MSKSILLAALLLLGCAGNQATPSAKDALIDGVIEAYGGLDALRSVQGYRMVGSQVATQWQQTSQTTRWVASDDRMRIDIRYPNRSEVRFSIGDKVWTGPDLANQEPAQPARVQSIRLQCLRLQLPLRLNDQRADVVHAGQDEAGRELLQLQVTAELGIEYAVDAKTHRIVRVRTSMTGPPEMSFHAEYSQFHMISGVLFAFREKTWAGETLTSEFQASDFEVNPPQLENSLRNPGEV